MPAEASSSSSKDGRTHTHTHSGWGRRVSEILSGAFWYKPRVALQECHAVSTLAARVVQARPSVKLPENFRLRRLSAHSPHTFSVAHYSPLRRPRQPKDPDTRTAHQHHLVTIHISTWTTRRCDPDPCPSFSFTVSSRCVALEECLSVHWRYGANSGWLLKQAHAQPSTAFRLKLSHAPGPTPHQP